MFSTVKPPIKDTPKEDKSLNKGQAESTLVYTLYIKSPLKEDNLSTKDKTPGPESVLIKRFPVLVRQSLSSQIFLFLQCSFLLNPPKLIIKFQTHATETRPFPRDVQKGRLCLTMEKLSFKEYKNEHLDLRKRVADYLCLPPCSGCWGDSSAGQS